MMHIEQVAVEALRPYPHNARTHSRAQIRKIAKSIEKFGFVNPVLVDDQKQIIAGHGRVEAAKLLGMKTVPTVLVSHLSEAEKRAYILADNKLALDAGWDREILAIELQGLIDIGFEVELSGFETAEIDIILEDVAEAKSSSGPEDQIPEEPEGLPVTRTGDLWVLGPHRLICADARDEDAYRSLMDGEKAAFVFTDPPYNVAIDGHVSGLGKVRHREFAMASGEMSGNEFTAFLEAIFRNLVKFSSDGSIHDICMDWRHMAEVLTAGNSTYTELKNVCVWNKNNAGMGSLYRSKHELVFVFKNGSAPHINNVELGRFGRSRSNVWDYAGVNTFRPGRMDELALHPTVKPVALVADAIKDCSRRNDIVLDPFSGSGTTIIAAEKTGRRARVIEIDPAYCDVAVRRWQQFSGKKARLVDGGKTFEEVSEERVTPLPASSSANIPQTH
jgi:DNA modification methylase